MMDGPDLDFLAQVAMADRQREALAARRAAEARREHARLRAHLATGLAGLALCVDRQAARLRLSDRGNMGPTAGSRSW
jgi:hypothetical protein